MRNSRTRTLNRYWIPFAGPISWLQLLPLFFWYLTSSTKSLALTWAVLLFLVFVSSSPEFSPFTSCTWRDSTGRSEEILASCSLTLAAPSSCSCILVSFGFHYSIATILLSLWNLITIIMAIVFFVLAFNNIIVIVFHPAFSTKEIKLYDDPTMIYSSGDNVRLCLLAMTTRKSRTTWSRIPSSHRRFFWERPNYLPSSLFVWNESRSVRFAEIL